MFFFFFCLNMGRQILLSTGGDSTYSEKARGRVSSNVSCLDEKLVVLVLFYSLEEAGLSVYKSAHCIM